jgi:hypothetical protein
VHLYRYSSALAILIGALLVGCRDETPTDPTPTAAAPTPGPMAALVGAPNTWEQVASPPTARYATVAGSAVNANGRSILYMFGGALTLEGLPGLSNVEAYNIATNRWATKAGMVEPAGFISGVGYINGKLYLPGGTSCAADVGCQTSRVLRIYDPAGDTWTLGADMPVANSRGVSGVIDNRLYVLTGGSSPQLFRYNPVQNRWVRLKSCPNFHIEGFAGVIKGKLYVAGGYRVGTATRGLDIYDPATNNWTSGAPLPSVHSGGVGVVLAGQFYVIGGDTGEVVAYNPNTNRWVKKASFPVPNARFMSGDKVTLDGKARIVVHSGSGAADDGRPTYVYTP